MVVAYQMLNLMTILLENYTNLSSKHKQHSCSVAFQHRYTVAKSDAEIHLAAGCHFICSTYFNALVNLHILFVNILYNNHTHSFTCDKISPARHFQFNVLYYTP